MSNKKNTLGAWVDSEFKESVRVYAEKNNISMSEIIRSGVSLIISASSEDAKPSTPVKDVKEMSVEERYSYESGLLKEFLNRMFPDGIEVKDSDNKKMVTIQANEFCDKILEIGVNNIEWVSEVVATGLSPLFGRGDQLYNKFKFLPKERVEEAIRAVYERGEPVSPARVKYGHPDRRRCDSPTYRYDEMYGLGSYVLKLEAEKQKQKESETKKNTKKKAKK
jgi:hypothetical protein